MANAIYVNSARPAKDQRLDNAARLHRGEHVVKDPPSLITFILLVDKEAQAKIKSSLLTQCHAPLTKKVLQGSLLKGYAIPCRGQGKARRLDSTHRCYLVCTLSEDVEFECTDSEVNRVAEDVRELLKAISTDAQRLKVFKDPELITYALSLRKGCLVRVKMKHEEVRAVVKYIGPVPGVELGTFFGVELIDEHQRGQGTCDGEFQKERFFQTDPDCALFVTVHKLIPSDIVLYENIPKAHQQTTSQPNQLNSCGEFYLGMTVFCSVGSGFKKGKVVFITVPPQQREPYLAVEMEKSEGGNQSWDGYWNDQRLYTPKSNVILRFLKQDNVIPEHLTRDEQPGQVPSLPAKERKEGRKPAEPFYASVANNKPKRTSQYTNAEQPEKSHKTSGVIKRDMSDDLHQATSERRHEATEELLSYSGDQNKPKSSLTSKLNKMKNKLYSGSKEQEPQASKSAQWYSGTESPKESLMEKRPVHVDVDEDVMKGVTDVIYKDWRTIAFSLYLQKEDIDQIERKFGSEKDRTDFMLKIWQKKHTVIDKISRLAEACRTCHFDEIADELEQGLDENLLMEISQKITDKKWRPFALCLHFSDTEIDQMERDNPNLLPRVRMMLGNWRMGQSFNSDKIMLLSRALHHCGLRQLELQVARGLDDDIISSFAIRIDTDWKILALSLRLTTADVHHLEDFPKEKQPYQMLMLWRRKQPRGVDVLGALYKGLKESGLPDLADDLVQGVDDDMLYKIAMLVGDTWERLGSHLGFTDGELKALHHVDANEEINSILTMLERWRERHDYSNDRLQTLLKALRKCGLENVADLYEKPPKAKRMVNDSRVEANQGARPKYDHKSVVTKEILNRVSKEVTFKDIVRALCLSNAKAADIGSYCTTNEQRVFKALDGWRRFGSSGERSISELLQILAEVGGKTMLVDDIMRMEASRSQKDAMPATREDPLETSFFMVDDDPPATEEEIPFPDLEVNSMVEVTHRVKSYGVIRWIGFPEGSKSVNKVAGIELETPLTHGVTDGTFGKQRYFMCDPHKALFVHLSKCRPDSRFPSQSQTFKVSKRQTSLDFGGFSSPTVSGYIDPPEELKREFVGMQKGIQGDQNSCYLDTTLFSMFAYNNVFDPLLKRTAGEEDLPLYSEVQKILRESIVNPLRKNGFVRADRVLQLREHLDKLGTTKGLMNEEKDPEEFLHTLLSEVFKSRPLLNIRHLTSKAVDTSNIYQIFMEKDNSFTVPTVEQLLLQSFQDSGLKLTEAPSCLIVQMPRFGKDYKMYKRIVPSLQLDITNIIEDHPRQCIVCGNLALLECKDCRKDEGLADTINIKNYCEDCFTTTHGIKRANHEPVKLLIADAFLRDFYTVTMDKGYTEVNVDQHRQIMLKPKVMDLFAVICIRTSHYVSFVKAGRKTNSEWVFFDSMADRQGDQQGYNIPQITHLKDFRSWVDPQSMTSSEMEQRQLPELMTRLLGDAYICMYLDSDKQNLTYV